MATSAATHQLLVWRGSNTAVIQARHICARSFSLLKYIKTKETHGKFARRHAGWAVHVMSFIIKADRVKALMIR